MHTLQYIWDGLLHDNMRKHDHYCKTTLHAMPGAGHVPAGKPVPIGVIIGENPHQVLDPAYGQNPPRVAAGGKVLFSAQARQPGYMAELSVFPDNFAARRGAEAVASAEEAALEERFCYDDGR